MACPTTSNHWSGCAHGHPVAQHAELVPNLGYQASPPLGLELTPEGVSQDSAVRARDEPLSALFFAASWDLSGDSPSEQREPASSSLGPPSASLLITTTTAVLEAAPDPVGGAPRRQPREGLRKRCLLGRRGRVFGSAEHSTNFLGHVGWLQDLLKGRGKLFGSRTHRF